jgi:PTH1 family peptidyl-tRNA hydrolase
LFAIIGLGNPGKEYEQTRHNVGFMVVDRLNERFQGSFKKNKSLYFSSKISVRQLPVLLVKPVTFMNLSGQAVRHLIDYFKIEDLSKLLVVLDDFNLPLGTVRLKPSGSAGGQKGLQSIIQVLKTDEIARLRIGIGTEFRDATSHVLSPFSRSEQKALPEIIDWAADSVESFILNGIDKTMSFYNRNLSENSL